MTNPTVHFVIERIDDGFRFIDTWSYIDRRDLKVIDQGYLPDELKAKHNINKGADNE